MCIQMWREEEKRPFWLFIINSLWYWFTATTEGLSEGKRENEIQQWDNTCENPAPFLSCISFLPLFGPLPWNILIFYANSTLLKRPAICQNNKWVKVPSHPPKVLQGSGASELGSALRELKQVVELSGTEAERISSRQTTHSCRFPPSLSQWHHPMAAFVWGALEKILNEWISSLYLVVPSPTCPHPLTRKPVSKSESVKGSSYLIRTLKPGV